MTVESDPKMAFIAPYPEFCNTLLLGKETSVEYVTGMVRYLFDQLSAVAGFSDLSPQDQQRLTLIGYNLGWEGEKGLKANIEKYGFEWVIDFFDYDNETLDEYLRWRAEQ